MNVRTATLLSIVGVLAAGTAAVAVNTQVLSGSDGPSDVPTPLTLPVATQVYTVPGVVEDGTTVVVEDGSANSVTPQSAVEAALNSTTPPSTAFDTTPGSLTPPTPQGTQMAFRIGDAAVATVDTAGGLLTIVSVEPAPGWTVHETTGSGSVRIEIELKSPTTKIEFGAFLSGGEVITSTSSESLVSSGYDDDDDDHEDHDDDDHDDDDEGDDDDDDDDHDRGDDDD